ncbi:MAG: hypothetical protein R3A52_18495 [Polyangiales bacterium]
MRPSKVRAGVRRWVIDRWASPAGDGLLDALRAVARGDLTVDPRPERVGPSGAEALSTLVKRVGALVLAARASRSLHDAAPAALAAASARVGEAAARERVSLERAVDDLAWAAGRARELHAVAEGVVDCSERSALVSLNAEIEGLRAGGEAARGMSLLGDELRRLNQRGAAGATSLAEGLTELSAALDAARVKVESAREALRALSDEAARAAAAAEGARRAERALGEALEGWSLVDDETAARARELTAAAERLAGEAAALRARLGAVDGAAKEELARALAALREAAGEG